MTDDGFWIEPADDDTPAPTGGGDIPATDTAALPTQREHASPDQDTGAAAAEAVTPSGGSDAAPVTSAVPDRTTGDAEPDAAPLTAAVPAPTTGDAGAEADSDLLKPRLEAILMVVENPVPDVVLAEVLDQPTAVVLAALRELSAEYTAQGRGFDLRQVAGGWRFYTRPEHAEAVERFVLDGQRSKLTQAALETLAVIAYRQPVSRSRVSAVRGVNCDGVMRTLLARGLVEEHGVEPETGAYLYRTTDFFLERMGLVSLDELPDLAPFLPEVDALEAETEGGFDGLPQSPRRGPVAAGGAETGDTGGENPAATAAEDDRDAPDGTDGGPEVPVPAADHPTDTTGRHAGPAAAPGAADETGQTTTDD